jgi:hypothetical protein
MADIKQSKIKAVKDFPYVSINANGTDYKVTTFIFNNRGEARYIDSSSLNQIIFETNHNTPFLLGSLSLNNNENSSTLNKVDFGNHAGVLSEVNSYGDGELFIKIIIKTKSSARVACDYTDEVILEKLFVVTDQENTVQNNNKLSVYYFIDVVYTHFANKKQIWNTDLLNEKAKYRNGYTRVNSGKALKHILIQFSGDDDIIDEKNWDNGQGNLPYYSLPAGEPALTAINEIMKTYVSSDQSGGILTYYNGQFQLQSIRSNTNKIYKNTKQKRNITEGIANIANLGENFAGGVKIQTTDNRQTYTNKEAGSILGKNYSYIPIDINKIQFTDVSPTATLNDLNKKEVIQFDPITKQFHIYSNEGTIQTVEERSSLNALPDGEDNKINIDVNTKFSESKERLFEMTDNNTTLYRGTIKLQKQLLNSLTKANFICNGDINISANKFIYITIDLNNKNTFAKKIPGFWYITKNLTTLASGQYSSAIECVKLDKPK